MNGSLIARYTYDTWGNTISIVDADGNEITSSTALPVQNPFRYRGYYYDSESGLYYLQSRYYDTKIVRFINSDDVRYIGVNGTVNSYNAFSYCENNSINVCDYTGQFPIAFVVKLIASVSAIIALLTGCAKTDTNFGCLEPFDENQKFGDLKKYNCYAYAMGYTDRWLHPGKGNKNVKTDKYNFGAYNMPNYYTVQDMQNWIINDFGDRARKISSATAKIENDEYRVAIRVDIEKDTKGKKNTRDFHLMKQHSDGNWSEKCGEGKPRILGKINPDNYGWSGNYYSKTLYLAVKKR